MIRYKADIMKALKGRGYSSYRLTQEKLLSHYTATSLRSGGPISTKSLDIICRLLECQPGDLLEWVPDEEPKKD